MEERAKADTVSNSELNEPLGSYVATCTVTTQTGDCDYEARIACHVIDEQTTLADIIAWYRRYHKTGLQIRIVDAT